MAFAGVIGGAPYQLHDGIDYWCGAHQDTLVRDSLGFIWLYAIKFLIFPYIYLSDSHCS